MAPQYEKGRHCASAPTAAILLTTAAETQRVLVLLSRLGQWEAAAAAVLLALQ